MMKLIGHGRSHAKIILMGEHSVVYGGPAIAVPYSGVEVHVKVKASELDKSTVRCAFYEGLVEEMPDVIASLYHTIRVTAEKTLGISSPLDYIIESTIPAERGMGSSAAVACALIRALYDFAERPLSQSQLLDLISEAETIAHGSPSGLDGLLMTKKNPVIFRRPQEIENLFFKGSLYLIVGDSGHIGRTKEAVMDVKRQIDSQDAKAKEAIEAIDQLVLSAREAIDRCQWEQLGHLMTKDHHFLQVLGVSSKELDALVASALTAGALGAKLTGGGRGGCMIAITDDPDRVEAIRANLMKAGAKTTYAHQLHTANPLL